MIFIAMHRILYPIFKSKAKLIVANKMSHKPGDKQNKATINHFLHGIVILPIQYVVR